VLQNKTFPLCLLFVCLLPTFITGIGIDAVSIIPEEEFPIKNLEFL